VRRSAGPLLSSGSRQHPRSPTRAAPLLCALLLGCPHAPMRLGKASHEGPAIRVADADELARRVQEVNDGYGTMETVHRVTIEIALGEGRSEKRSFKALLAIRRPGHFRVQLLGPMQIRLMDLLYEAGQVKVVQLADELRRSSRIGELVNDIAGDIAAIYRLDPQPHPTRRRLEETVSTASGRAPLYELRELRDDTLLRQMTVFAATLAVSRAEIPDGQGGSRTITYGEYEHFGPLVVPRQIHLSREGRVFYWLAIQVESATIDPKLDDRLFLYQGQEDRGR
jgi:hypothetical protein